MNNLQNVCKKQNCHMNNHDRYQPTIFDFFTRPLDSFNFGMTEPEQSFKVDLKDEGDHYQLKAEMPGVKKEDIKLDFNDGVLSIKAEHNTEKKQKDNQGFVIMERNYGMYEREFRFDDADPENIDAAFVNGELDIYIKKEAAKQSKHISIN